MLKIIKCKPLLNHIITTANVYDDADFSGELISDDSKMVGSFKEYQTVVAIGPNVKDVKVGDLVVINPKAYAKPVHKTRDDSVLGLMGPDTVEMRVEFPIVDINSEPHLFLYDRDVDLVIEEHEFINDSLSLESNKEILS